jgi:hypothetical protein
MALRRREVVLRIDRDCIEVQGVIRGRRRGERTSVGPGSDLFESLGMVLRTSRLLGPGRTCHLDVAVESARTVYRDVLDPEGKVLQLSERGLQVDLPNEFVDRLIPVLAGRRTHGPTVLIAGPVLRALGVLDLRVERGSSGRGLIIDRSCEAVTVLIIDEGKILWARGGPADDPMRAVELLVARAAHRMTHRARAAWWHLEDIASPDDDRRLRRESLAFEAACDGLVGHLPRILVAS